MLKPINSATTNTSKDTTIPLSQPIALDGLETRSLTMRCPKVKDMLAVDTLTGSDAEKEIVLLANLCETNPLGLHELTLTDYAKLQAAYQDFLS